MLSTLFGVMSRTSLQHQTLRRTGLAAWALLWLLQSSLAFARPNCHCPPEPVSLSVLALVAVPSVAASAHEHDHQHDHQYVQHTDHGAAAEVKPAADGLAADQHELPQTSADKVSPGKTACAGTMPCCHLAVMHSTPKLPAIAGATVLAVHVDSRPEVLASSRIERPPKRI